MKCLWDRKINHFGDHQADNFCCIHTRSKVYQNATTKDEVKESVEKFFLNFGFPQCLGAIDCT